MDTLRGAGRPVQRHGGGVSTFSRPVRIAASAPFVLATAFVVVQIVLWFLADDPSAAAMWTFLLMPVGGATVVVLRALWQPSAEWRRQAHRDRLAGDQLARRYQEPPVNVSIRGSDSS